MSARQALVVEGRALQTEDSVRLSFPGSQLKLATDGHNLKIHLRATRFDMVVDIQRDGGNWEEWALQEGENVVEFTIADAKGIAINIIRRNEAWQGDLIFVSAETDGRFVTPDPLPKIKLLFIGDSITAGAGTQSRRNADGEMEAVSNARLAYPRVLGTRLNAQVHQVAYGGRGVVRDWQGTTDINNAPQFYDRVMPDNPDHIWNPADYQPDIISIMLGTNDFNPGIPDRESWTGAYRQFVTRVRGDYPDAQIFLVSSPMTDGEKGEALKAYVRDVAEDFETPDVAYIQVKKYPGEPWDSHPNAQAHQGIADELEPYFRAALTD